jgi:peptidoglycan/xylan/chitin deacetylase (PgdA/CDA1 family)
MANNKNYPRDLIGYGARPPHPHWPHEAVIAVSVVLNYEEGGEYCVLHGDAHSESVLTDLGAVDALPNARNLNVESNFEYGSRVGFWEIMRLLRSRRVDATVYAVGMALERNAEAAAEIAQSGFEVACHGERWIDYQDMRGGSGARAHAAQHRDHHLNDRSQAGGVVHRSPEHKHASPGHGNRRLSLRQRRLQR